MLALLRTYSWQELRHHPWRSAAAVVAVMLGVALAFSVHLINASALSEFSSALRTVEGEVRAALGATFSAYENLAVAGRTDTGVHALSQVVHFDTEVDRPMSAWVQGTNAHLHLSIRVLWAHPVSDEFHARYSARGRHYQFVLYNHNE